MRRFLMIASLLSMLAGCSSQPVASAPDHGHFVDRQLQFEGRTFRYQVFVPARAASPGKRPLVLFLHGSGERGDDGVKPTLAGLGPWLKENRDSFPALAVFPQVPEGEEWRDRNARMALAVLDAAGNEFQADPRRIYLTGMSMGGYGSWELALTRPTHFAAVVPICMPTSPGLACHGRSRCAVSQGICLNIAPCLTIWRRMACSIRAFAPGAILPRPRVLPTTRPMGP